MGYDLHITRALAWHECRRYPILGTEIDALVRDEPDLTIPPDASRQADSACVIWSSGSSSNSGSSGSSGSSDGDRMLRFSAGKLTVKHPGPELIRRMTALAARLDAWVIGDDGEVYQPDGDRVVDRQPGPEAYVRHPRFITRGSSSSGLNGHAPILSDEWAELVAAQPDFVTMTRIEAALPSGLRWISCPPVACWTGHPSGRPMPFFFDDDLIEVQHADGPTVHRMTALAATLTAKVLDDEDQPA